MSQNVSLSKGEKVKVTLSPASKLTAKGAEFSVESGDCTIEDDEKDETVKYIVASESVGQSIIKVSGKIHPKKELGEGEAPEPPEEGEEEEEEEEEEVIGEELIIVDVTDPNSSALGINVGTPEPIEEEEEEEEGGEEGAKKEKKKTSRRKKSKK